MNVPLQHGLDDEMFLGVFNSIYPTIAHRFSPDAIVIQCGSDGLAKDPLGGFNLTPRSLSACVQQIVASGLPTILLGGGGYNIPNTVRCWARITADLVGCQLPEDVPDSDPFFLRYGPDYEMELEPGLLKNNNSKQQVDQLIQHVIDNINNIGS